MSLWLTNLVENFTSCVFFFSCLPAFLRVLVATSPRCDLCVFVLKIFTDMTVPEPTSRQTLSHLLNLFQQRGIKPKNKLGQNFLIDLNLLDLLLRSAELTRDDLVIEIGSGTGGLTARLAAQAGTVLSVEIDPAFHELTLEATAGCENVVAIRADVLRNKNELSPQVLSALAELRQKSGMHHLKVVANLPYAVATPFLSNLLLSDLPVERMVVTVQWEIAERLLAVPATKAYGALAVLVQSLAGVELIRRLPPSVFFPRPQVASAIVCIRPNSAKRDACRRRGAVSSFPA